MAKLMASVDHTDIFSERVIERVLDRSYLPALSEVREAEEHPEYGRRFGEYNRSASEGERFEIWTAEYIDALAAHLAARLQDGPGVVLEIGAGDGYLAKFLRDRLRAKEISVYATDIDSPEDGAEVEALECEQALLAYQPDVVISSWMPDCTEWTGGFRATPTVEEYIVIGAPALCGTRLTWEGYPSPEVGEFAEVSLSHLDPLKRGLFSDEDAVTGWQSLTRGFRRISRASG